MEGEHGLFGLSGWLTSQSVAWLLMVKIKSLTSCWQTGPCAGHTGSLQSDGSWWSSQPNAIFQMQLRERGYMGQSRLGQSFYAGADPWEQATKPGWTHSDNHGQPISIDRRIEVLQRAPLRCRSRLCMSRWKGPGPSAQPLPTCKRRCPASSSCWHRPWSTSTPHQPALQLAVQSSS